MIKSFFGASLPFNVPEEERLRALARYEVVDTPPEAEFDALARLAAQLCGTPLAAISLVDDARLWFKARVGLTASELPREGAFCAYAIETEEVFVVPDAARDSRFAAHPAVAGDAGLRFYAGAPLVTPDGYRLGTLCVFDHVPRHLDPAHIEGLRTLARQVMARLELARLSTLHHEDTYRRIAANVPGMVYRFVQRPDGTARFLFVSEGSRDVCGLEPGDFLRDAAAVLDRIHPDDRRRYERLGARSLATLEPWLWEGRARHASGDWRWIRGASRPERRPNGDVVWDGILTDITAQKRAEEALRASEARYRAVTEAASDAIITVDLDGTVLFVNGAAERIFGRPAAELLGAPVERVLPGPPSQLRALGLRGEVAVGPRGASTGEAMGRHASGRELPVEVSFGAFEEDGRRHFTGIVRDVTERKRAEEALRRSEQYRNLFRHANDAIVIFEPEGEVVLDVNDRACEVYGLPRERFLGRSLKEFSVDAARGEEHLGRLVRDGACDEFVTVQRRADGTPMHLEINASLIDFGGRPAVLSMNRDITARVRTEEALARSEEQLRQSQKMESIGTLAGGVAHDFNNLLTAILGYSDLALHRLPADSPLRFGLGEIKKAGERASGLTRKLLAFSRRQQLQRRTVDLNDTVGDLMTMLRRIIGEDVEVRLQPAPGVPPVFADPAQIEQVVMNLAVNARDAMPDGGTLTLETEAVAADALLAEGRAEPSTKRYVRLRVRDTGTGMSDETRARIFEPFFTTKEMGKGTGLGLSMVYGIVTQHDGLIEVDSAPGAGTEFRIYLPAAHEPISTLPPPLEGADGGSETILVVEDEGVLRTLAEEMLTSLGYAVLTAADGLEAVATWRAHADAIDLVLLDVVMPRAGGREAYERIRADDTAVPIVFMTGYSAQGAQGRFIEETGAPLLQKPYDVQSLGRKVRDALAHRKKASSPRPSGEGP